MNQIRGLIIMADSNIQIRELMGKIERKELQLPEMQRSYVWKNTQVRDLFDSLYREYPTGTILTWRPSKDEFTRPFVAEPNVERPNHYEHVLDGQQRLTSLFLILRSLKDTSHIQQKRIDLLFNLNHSPLPQEGEYINEIQNLDVDLIPNLNESTVNSIQKIVNSSYNNEDFSAAPKNLILEKFNQLAFIVYTKKLAKLNGWIPVTKVFETDDDMKLLEECGINHKDNPLFKIYLKRLTRLRKIEDYFYHVRTIESLYNYEQATDIFVRINSRGIRLRGSDLATAQITAKWNGSRKYFESSQVELSNNGFNLDLGILVKNLVAFASGQSRFKIVENLSKEKLEQAWGESQNSLKYALNFLRESVKIDNPTLLSSPFILITLAYFFRNYNERSLENSEADLLKFWILVSNSKARYSRGSSESYLDQDLLTISKNKNLFELIKNLESQVIMLNVTSEELENKDSKNPHFKTMYLAFRESGAEDWNEPFPISQKLIGSKFKLEFHHIFPKSLLQKNGFQKQEINDISNLAFVTGNTNKKIRDKSPKDYLPSIIEKRGEIQLSHQCIPLEEKLWNVERYHEFLEARREQVSARLNEFLQIDWFTNYKKKLKNNS